MKTNSFYVIISDMQERMEVPEKHSVVFAIWDGSQIQLEERLDGNYAGFIVIPGGGIESNETVEEGLIREVGEEYGATPVVYENIGLFLTTNKMGVLHVYHLYLITKWEGDLSHPESDQNNARHISAGLNEAFEICANPLTRVFLNRVTDVLSR